MIAMESHSVWSDMSVGKRSWKRRDMMESITRSWMRIYGEKMMRFVNGYRTYVRVVDKFEQIPVWVSYLGEDEEMTYYATDYAEGIIWGVRR